MKRLLVFTSMLIICCLGLRVYSGLYVDDEWGDTWWFIKHRPTWDFVFMPILHNGDEISDENRLNPTEMAAHRQYQEFVENRRFDVLVPNLF